MPLLTTEQQDTLWNNRKESVKIYTDETTQNSSTFDFYYFESNLDGFRYDFSITNGITHSSSAETVETKVKEHLATLEYKQPINISSVDI